MRRTTIILSAALMLLGLAAPSALARHHRRHHSRIRHARIEHFGSDVTANPTNSNPSDNAGEVQGFHNGVLTIMLADGSTISGAVNRDSELECMAPAQTQTVHADGDGGSGDQSGEADNSGSDNNQPQSSGDQSAGENQGDAAEQNENQAEDQNENQAEDQNENQAEDQNENQAGDQNENEAGKSCSASNLTSGTVVREAELRVSGTGSTWKKVETGS